MKKFKHYSALSALGLMLFASCTSKDATITVEGVNSDTSEMVLTKTGVEIAKNPVNGANTLLEVKDIAPGYYKLNEQLIYLEPGFDMNIDLEDGEPVFEGKGEKENNVLQERLKTEQGYTHYIDSVKTKFVMEEEAYFAYLDTLTIDFDKNLQDPELSQGFVSSEKRRTEQIKKYLISNYAFDHGIDPMGEMQLMAFITSLDPSEFEKPETMIKMDSIQNAMRKNAFKKEKVDELRKMAFEGFDWNNEELYTMNSMGYGMLTQAQLMTVMHSISEDSKKEYDLGEKDYLPQEVMFRDIVIDSVSNPAMKASMLTKYTSILIKMAPDFAEDAYEKFLANSPSETQKETINVVYGNFQKLKPGAISAKFVDYHTPEDKSVSLEDFKGKYVYIDVWATWCGPCKKEIPYLKKVEEQFHDDNIAFISISVDVEKKTDAWKQMVKDMDLKGVQLIADNDFKSEFIKAYNIAAIPRFILIDPEGKIVNSDALRPSDPALTMLLETLLSV
ncbi:MULTISPECIES: redoxin family protein [Flavobacteriaceae]|uniref:redoxin family protein n=1 Tax=Flavobacteriaceae TaxID=49546 RepID=UPI001FE88EDF|nr:MULTISPECIES: redoxin family protein [Allomuricauda]MDC6366796.1 redoxin family protein [Muricauda sp. AC10]